jgi:hypothetical protein
VGHLALRSGPRRCERPHVVRPRRRSGVRADPRLAVGSNVRRGYAPPALRRFTFGQLYDAIVYHGNVPDSVVAPDVATFRAAMGPKLDRRTKLLADAVKLRQQRRP